MPDETFSCRGFFLHRPLERQRAGARQCAATHERGGARRRPGRPRGHHGRDLKLSFAGSLKNWNLADFEVAQINKSFRRAAQLYPVFGNVPVARLIAEISEPVLAEVKKSIKDRDSGAFLKSFDKLTTACNSCHQEAKLGFIKMQVPTASPFSNQVFPPAQK